MFGDVIQIHTVTEDKQTFFSVSKEDKPSFALELNWK